MFLILMTAMFLPVCAVDEKTPAKDDAVVVARIGGQEVTLAEIDETITPQLLQIEQQKYDLRLQALEQYIAKTLLEREAGSREIDLKELYEIQIRQKVTEPTDDEVSLYFEQNKHSNRNFQGKTLETARPMVVQTLMQQRMIERQNAYIDELKANAKVRVVFDPPRMEVPTPAGEPSRGPADAPVTIVEFSDYQCGYCKKVHTAVEQIIGEYGDSVRFVYRDYALPFHQGAVPAARAARCAGEQGHYWEYHNDLLENPGDLSIDDLVGRAGKIDLDQAAFSDCLSSARFKDEIDSGTADGLKIGVTATPTFFINGRMVAGAATRDEFAAIIDEELARTSGKQP